MVVTYEIKHNRTVWSEGLSFIHKTILYMPETVLKQILYKNPNSGFSKYLKEEWARWNRI